MNLEDKWKIHKRAEDLSSSRFCDRSTEASLIKSGRVAGLSNLHDKYSNTGGTSLSWFAVLVGYSGCIIKLAVKAPRMSDEEALLIKTCLTEDLHLLVEHKPASRPAGAF